jgi:delta8-fatty-acid desaturase
VFRTSKTRAAVRHDRVISQIRELRFGTASLSWSKMGESKQQRLWTPTEVATRILEGDTIVIHQGRVLRITPAWLSSHPGGSLAILHFVGRDATDEVNAFHSEAALERMKGFVVGKVEIGEKGWQPFIPPVETGWVRRRRENDGQFEWYREAEHLRDSTTLDSGLSFNPHNHSPSEIHLLQKSQSSSKVEDKPVLESITPSPPTVSPETQTKHSLAYRELHARVTAAGLYQTRYIAGYGPEFLRYFFLGACSYALYSRGWFFTSALLLGMLWHQLTFIAHDLGHNGVTHNWVIDRLLGILIADTLGGLSIGWWVDVRVFHPLRPIIWAHILGLSQL